MFLLHAESYNDNSVDTDLIRVEPTNRISSSFQFDANVERLLNGRHQIIVQPF